MRTITNLELELAWDFIEKTNRNIFLTGNAGTGKTTFLRKVKERSSKRLVVVAPTGVAAINAKGVTIHSFFQMAFGPILPTSPENNSGNPQNNYQNKFNRNKIDIIRSLELLIIDEISMVRADLLDGIDKILRRYKNRDKVFGGIQVLMIGDLQQLSPVVKPQEWDLLRAHYKTPYFFSSISFISCQAVSVELKHIYRQDDEQFITILNEIRNDQLSTQSAEILNKRYLPDFISEKDSGYITLTTHNDRANLINKEELNKNVAKSYFFKAEVLGSFSKHAFPTHEELELKNGAQVMFIKNDSDLEKRYFNGKIGRIVSINKKTIKVRCDGDNFDIDVSKEVWEKVKYTLDVKTKEIVDEIVGSFSQIPLRLAWAITIHKSQGLTFEKAIIDAEASFAHGQTYVALSRCKSLEGIILKRPIDSSSIISDDRVSAFTSGIEENCPDEKELIASKKIYQLNLIEELFDFQALIYPIARLINICINHRNSIKGKLEDSLLNMRDEGVIKLQKISRKFHRQLLELSKDIDVPETNEMIQGRIKKGIDYFIKHCKESIQDPLEAISYTTKNKVVMKELKEQFRKLKEELSIRLFALNELKDGYSSEEYLKIKTKAIFNKEKSSKNRIELTSTDHPILLSSLRKLRDDFSKKEFVSFFQVFTQDTLYELCEFLPKTEEELLVIKGMGKVRVEKYGLEIMKIVRAYCSQNDAEPRENILEVRKAKRKAPQKGATQRASFEMFKKGVSIKEIAKKRGLVEGTIQGHLAQFVKNGELEITEIIPKDRYVGLKKAIESTNYESLRDLKEKLDASYGYLEIKLVLQELEEGE